MPLALICGFCMQISDFSTRISSLYRSQTSTMVLAFKTSWLAPELLVSMGPIPHLSFLHAKQRLLDQNFKSLLSPDLTYGFLHAKQRLLDQNYKSIWVPDLTYGFLQAHNVISIRITSLYGSQPSSVIFAFKTATFGSEFQVSMGPRAHLWFFAFKTATLAPEFQISMGPSLHLWFCECKTMWLASALLVSIGPSPHLWFLQAKQQLLDQN